VAWSLARTMQPYQTRCPVVPLPLVMVIGIGTDFGFGGSLQS
jgi:hypothetical protein